MHTGDAPKTDALDLNHLLLAVARRKVWLVLFSLAAGLLVYGLSLLTPQTYQAIAYVLVTKPMVQTSLEKTITARPIEPDFKSIAMFVKSPEVLRYVYESAAVSDMQGFDLTFNEFDRQLSAQLVGNAQLQLTVRDADPHRAAAIANEWARICIDQIDRLYGIGESTLQWLGQQREQASEKWSKAQKTLIERFPQSPIPALEVQLEASRLALLACLQKIRDIDSTISEAHVLANQAAKLPEGSSRLPVGLTLALIGLQQRIAAPAVNIQLALSPEVMAQDYSIAQAQSALTQLIEALQEQREVIVGRSTVAQEQMAKLTAEIDAANYEISRLQQDREVAQVAYKALLTAEEDARMVSGTGNHVALPAGSAVAPATPISPRPLLYAVAAALLALMLGLFLALYIEFWRWERIA
jgi:uncharacterized protein involved in exopolysaccharide biosynthesis